MTMLKPIKLLPARERVASVLREAILSRELAKGTVLTLEAVSKQLDISSTPVREAFQILSREGLIELKPNKGVEVLDVNPKFIHDHYETRAVLESETAAMICRNGVDIGEIEAIHRQCEACIERKDVERYSNLNQAFHMAIWNAAGNKKMTAILSELWNGLSIGKRVTEEEYARQSISEHWDVLEALSHREADKARQCMKAHIIRSKESMLTRFQ